ncbi:MAG: cysteine desulfurase family protein [Polyangiaceae bacterium]
MLYLDWNASAPLAPEVVLAMRDALDTAWANPASVHGPGRTARAAVERARRATAAFLHLDLRDVVLTSGGTEANNLAVRGALARLTRDTGRPARGVVSAIEHPSVLRAFEAAQRDGVEVTTLPPDSTGRVPPEALEALLRDRDNSSTLVSVQAVNHETGVVQPIAEIAQIAASAGAKLHVDAVQAAGKLDRASWADADLITITAHKLRGPKGIGALATRCGIKLAPVLVGGAQERGLRPGTQDPLAAVGFEAALVRARSGPDRYARLAPLRAELEAGLVELGGVVNGAGAPRAPHVTNVSFHARRWLGPELVAALDLEGVAVSSGSACSAGTAEPSPVIAASFGPERAASAVRVSLGDDATELDVVEALRVFSRVLGR